jgi:transglutaminase-like putative cysteine protease
VPDHLVTSPSIPIRAFRDGFGNWCSRIVAPAGRTRLSASGIVNDTGEQDLVASEAQQHAVEDLPDEALVFLLGSRYCETDRLSDIAWSLFGKTPLGWGRVQAICDYVHQHIAFGYEHARASRTGWEAFCDRTGVCRDYAHLAVTFCRCMNIPARYCTGYLGDIGVPASDAPMDFAAWFEAYVGGAWYTFDARNNIPRIGRVLIARGRGCRDQHDFWTEYAPQLYGTDRRNRSGGMTPGPVPRYRGCALAAEADLEIADIGVTSSTNL